MKDRYLFALRIIGTVFFLVGIFLVLRELVSLIGLWGLGPGSMGKNTDASFILGEDMSFEKMIWSMVLRWYFVKALHGGVLIAMGLYLMKSHCEFIFKHCHLPSYPSNAEQAIKPTKPGALEETASASVRDDDSRFMPPPRQ